MKDIVIQFGALAQESRLEIFQLLMTNGETGLFAGEISKNLGITANTLSFHLKALQQADLIKSERHGRYISYSLNIEGYKSLLKFMTEDCCKGNPTLCATDVECC